MNGLLFCSTNGLLEAIGCMSTCCHSSVFGENNADDTANESRRLPFKGGDISNPESKAL
jgi:hypothetical protein